MPEPASDTAAGLRQCPTRADGAVVLIAHTITSATCQERQRALYHKCFTCVHRNDRTLAETAVRRLPAPERPPANGLAGNGSPGKAPVVPAAAETKSR
jgi:hypothetical protein